MRKIILLLALFVTPILIFAQELKILSLGIEQAQNYAIEHNKSLKNSKTDLDIAKKQLWQAISQGLPQVSASVDYTNFFNYEMEFGLGGGSTPSIDFTKLDQGDYEILGLLQQSMGSGTSIKMKNSATAKLQVTQLLFSGQYISGVQMAKIAQILTDMNLEKSEIDIRESVINTYYLSLITQKSLDIIEGNIENLNLTLTQTKALLSAGMIEETDVDQINMSITMLENTKRSLLRNIELNNNIMKFQLGIENEVELILTESFDSVLENIDLSNVLNLQFNPSDNITIRMLDKQEELSNKMLSMEKWSYAPTLVAAYNYNQKLITTDFDMNPKNLLALSLSVPIFSSGQRNAKVEQKKLELFKVQNNKDIVVDQLLMQEKQLRYNLTSALEQYDSQKANVELAKKIYNNIELKFRQGVSSSFDLIQASTNLLQAENNYVSSSMELLQAKLQFDKLISKI